MPAGSLHVLRTAATVVLSMACGLALLDAQSPATAATTLKIAATSVRLCTSRYARRRAAGVPGRHRPRWRSASPRRPCRRRIAHLTQTRLEHLNSSLAELPTLRARLAQMRIETDRARAHLGAVLDSLETPGPATQLLVLEAKAAATEAAVDGHRPGDADLRRRRVRRRARPRAACSATRARRSSWRRRPIRPTTSSAARCAAWRCSDGRGRCSVGAVMYDPKVSVIWEIIRDFFEAQGCPIDVVVLQQLRAAGRRRCSTATIDIAWNSPLAWLDAQRRSGGDLPRDRDARHRSRPRLVLRRAPRGGPVRTLADLRGRTLAVGAIDSPQATLIPLGRLRQRGPRARRPTSTVRRFDVLVGKHGDHVGGERDAFECLQRGEAAACAMLDLNWEAGRATARSTPTEFAIVGRDRPLRPLRLHRPRRTSTPRRSGAGSRRCSRCATTIPAHREMMDLEGLKAWLPGRTDGLRRR